MKVCQISRSSYGLWAVWVIRWILTDENICILVYSYFSYKQLWIQKRWTFGKKEQCFIRNLENCVKLKISLKDSTYNNTLFRYNKAWRYK